MKPYVQQSVNPWLFRLIWAVTISGNWRLGNPRGISKNW